MAVTESEADRIELLQALLQADKRSAYRSGNGVVISPPQIEPGEEYAVFGGDVEVPEVLEEQCVAKIYRVHEVSTGDGV
ncbi:hypothetical protein GJR96_09320 [Haloferax sp. MBLA0076]|uniref:Uncharacterized protein n=1 Tax=Haloferax litoreum TaxID=2666140 RepID=A0A6A8GG58_9EURY|nr:MULTISPECIES: hypothetical protein [Haloferax]KAB1193628.1 hypothetical protein Hfx1148_09300 [Haloferax sp. CBA1148]MRX22153.1 hypothetical protein [Haloferax litoreum]